MKILAHYLPGLIPGPGGYSTPATLLALLCMMLLITINLNSSLIIQSVFMACVELHTAPYWPWLWETPSLPKL
jgi:hypothetical protein